MKSGDMIKVHLYGCDGKEIKTRNCENVFEVYEKNGMLGIDWDAEGQQFRPFHKFSHNVVFEDVRTGKSYHYSNFEKGIAENVVLGIKEAYDWIRENTCLMQDTLMLDFQCLEYCVKKGILKPIPENRFVVA